MKEAVRTSILSTRWRYLFASMTCLQFDDPFLCQYGTTHPSVNNFMNFVDRLLFFSSKATLECFQLNFSEESGIDGLCIYGWICAALWRGIFVLDREPVVALDKLVELEILEKFQDCDGFDWQEMWLLELLQRSPNLESLDFSLQEIKLYSESDAGRWMFELIKYLLKNIARVLRKLIIDTRQQNRDKQLRFAKQLLALARNSACQVLI
ncbi:F-box protein [Corchorus olitorius]|uniref:F-box protein n=1 Tax=Corchorus olitorius TaxID=93759 RepID=A0A1R3K4Y5_9ROSI|nr:F-box protein [Corchorus olitorius]